MMESTQASTAARLTMIIIALYYSHWPAARTTQPPPSPQRAFEMDDHRGSELKMDSLASVSSVYNVQRWPLRGRRQMSRHNEIQAISAWNNNNSNNSGNGKSNLLPRGGALERARCPQ
jgi:hypothetical protein